MIRRTQYLLILGICLLAGGLALLSVSAFPALAQDATPTPLPPYASILATLAARAPVKEVVAAILEQKPAVVFAPQVETSAGMLLPGDYLHEVAAAVREVDGLFVLDAIAAGTLWVDMGALGIDIVVSAPQKGWSGSPCAGLVMLGERARARIDSTTSTSYAADLKKWLQIMEAYENGGHAYHATLPTDALTMLRDVMLETERYGFDKVKANQIELGRQIRALLEAKGFDSVAAEGFKATCVVVSYTSDFRQKPTITNCFTTN